MKANSACYNARIQKGGALLDDMRVLVRAWSDQQSSDQRQKAIESNVLTKRTRARVADTLKRAFLPRFVEGDPPVRISLRLGATTNPTCYRLRLSVANCPMALPSVKASRFIVC